ncbi:hypothetical protein Tco_0461557, partial [Tanacetum coccineum]
VQRGSRRAGTSSVFGGLVFVTCESIAKLTSTDVADSGPSSSFDRRASPEFVGLDRACLTMVVGCVVSSAGPGGDYTSSKGRMDVRIRWDISKKLYRGISNYVKVVSMVRVGAIFD